MAKEARFIVLGDPKPKGRPRFSTRKTKDGKTFAKVYTPSDTVIYEEMIRTEYERQCSGIYFEKGVPVEVSISAYYSIPKSMSRKKADMMRSHQTRPVVRRKGDVDNLLKVVLDACNGVAFYDDSQVVDAHCYKYYGDIPMVKVAIREKRHEEIP